MLVVGIPLRDFGPNFETDPRASGIVTINGERKEYQVSSEQGFWFRSPGTTVWDKRQINHAGITDDDVVVFHCSSAAGDPNYPNVLIHPDEHGNIIVRGKLGPGSN